MTFEQVLASYYAYQWADVPNTYSIDSGNEGRDDVITIDPSTNEWRWCECDGEPIQQGVGPDTLKRALDACHYPNS